MKRKFCNFILLILIATVNLNAQENGSDNRWYFGFGGGYRNTGIKFSEIDEKLFPENKNLHNGMFSLFVEYAIGKDKKFAIRPGFTFLLRGGGIDNIYKKYYNNEIDNISYNLSSRYWDLRIPFIYYFTGSEKSFRPYVFISPVLGLPIRGKINYDVNYTDNTYSGYLMELTKANMSSFYFAGNVGIGLQYRFNVYGHKLFIGLEAGYEYGFTDTYSKREKNGEAIIESGMFTNVYDIKGSRKFSGFEIQATVGIPFSIFKKKEKVKQIETVTMEVVEKAVERVEEPVIPKVEKSCYSLEEISDMIENNESVEGKTICAVDAINFEFGKSFIERESYTYLDNLAEILKKTNMRVDVKGHTDNVGSADFNMKLSRDRAKSVVDYLIKKGVNEENLSYSYYGMSKPLTTNDTEEGRTINRRVEFEFLK